MSKINNELITLALQDEEFRKSLLSDPTSALQQRGFQLSEEEMLILKSTIDYSQDLDQRLSKVYVAIST